jgi:hypothetical protein
MKNYNNNRTKKSNGSRKSTMYKIARSLQLASAERKAFSTSQTSLATATAGTVYNISQGCIEGTSQNQRDGKSIFIRDITLKVRAVLTLTSSTVRFILLQDKMCTGTPPSVGDVLNTTNWLSTYNLINMYELKRFHVIWDKALDLSATGDLLISAAVMHRGTIPRLSYLGATDVAGANGRNSIYLIAIGSSTSSTHDYFFEMTYIDQ